jgi:hypothetical protein
MTIPQDTEHRPIPQDATPKAPVGFPEVAMRLTAALAEVRVLVDRTETATANLVEDLRQPLENPRSILPKVKVPRFGEYNRMWTALRLCLKNCDAEAILSRPTEQHSPSCRLHLPTCAIATGGVCNCGSGTVQQADAIPEGLKPYIAEPARRVIERIANAVGTMSREGSADFHAGCEAIMRECEPFFAQLGMIETGDGIGFDEDDFVAGDVAYAGGKS